MKRVIVPLIVALTYVTSVFAQDDGAEATDGGAVTEQSQPAEEPKKEEKKSMFHVDKRPDPNWGFRLGIHFSGISGQTLSFGWHLGGVLYPIKFFDASLGGDALGVKLFLEPNLFFLQKAGWGGDQYWLEVPVMGNFMFTLFGSRFKYSVGPYAAVGLFGEFDKIKTVSSTGTLEDSKVGRFDLGLNQTLGYEFAKNLWSEFSLGVGFLDMVEKEKGSSNFIMKITAGGDF